MTRTRRTTLRGVDVRLPDARTDVGAPDAGRTGDRPRTDPSRTPARPMALPCSRTARRARRGLPAIGRLLRRGLLRSDVHHLCRSCKLSGNLGTCTAARAGVDPRLECPAQAPATCGRAGGCDGMGACRLHPGGTDLRRPLHGLDRDRASTATARAPACPAPAAAARPTSARNRLRHQLHLPRPVHLGKRLFHRRLRSGRHAARAVLEPRRGVRDHGARRLRQCASTATTRGPAACPSPRPTSRRLMFPNPRSRLFSI